jgi:aspartate racemase
MSEAMSAASPHTRAKSLGVLGGMGPLAGAFFTYRLVQLTPATIDQQHIPVLLRNDPSIPDRSSALMRGGADPLPAMLHGIRFLDQAQVDCIAIPCNTAHLWFDPLRAAASAHLLHIAQAVVQDLRRQGVNGGKVGVMGTRATLEMGLYQRVLQAAGYVPLVPGTAEIDLHCTAAIEAVKANRLGQAFAPAAQGIERLRARGAVAVVLGCTELPLAVPHASRPGFGLVITDSIDALALAAIDFLFPHACA